MALPTSSLSLVCRAVADFIGTGLSAQANNIRVLIGAPSEAAKTDDKHRLNLFFYRFEPYAFDADVAPTDPWRIRMFCLITAFGISEEQIDAGENDLRILGEVMRVIHEKPVFDAVTIGDSQVRLQVVFHPLKADDINHIWSTQGDTDYRPSIAYEMALLPIFPRQRRIAPPRVGALGYEAQADMEARYDAFTSVAGSLPVAASTVDTRAEDWAPRLCFVHAGAAFESAAFAVGSVPTSLSVWAAGDQAESIALHWQEWHSDSGWTDLPSTESANPVGTAIDPENLPAVLLPSATLPFTDRPGQALLYGVRSYVRARDGATAEVRSNPLLITIYPAATP